MSEPRPSSASNRQRSHGGERLLEIVGRPGPPPRAAAGLVDAWYRESRAQIPFQEWCDPAARHLGAMFESSVDLATIEQAIVTFAQARAGADHTAAEVAADVVALVRLAWPSAGHEWDGWIDPVGLLARALSAWAAERVAVASSVDCIDPATGLVTAKFLERRVHELHAQCDALALSPSMTFGSVVVQLGLSAVAAPERIGVRVAAGRILADRFRAGETVAALSSSRTASRMAAVMPAYGIDRALPALRTDLTPLARHHGVDLQVGRVPFGIDAVRTFVALAGTPLAD